MEYNIFQYNNADPQKSDPDEGQAWEDLLPDRVKSSIALG